MSKPKKLDIKVMPKIPPQFWDRNRSLEANCTYQRKTNPNLKTQVRLGQQDLELWTKSSNDPYWLQMVNIEAFGPIEPINLTQPQNIKTTTPQGRGNLKRAATSPPQHQSTSKNSRAVSPQTTNQ